MQLLDSFSFERTQYNLRLRKAREVAQKPIKEMEEVTIEFFGDTYGDWLLHCHVLYHMMSGMTRIFSYDTPRDVRMKNYPASKLIDVLLNLEIIT